LVTSQRLPTYVCSTVLIGTVYQFALYNVAFCCLFDDAMSLLNDGLRTNFWPCFGLACYSPACHLAGLCSIRGQTVCNLW